MTKNLDAIEKPKRVTDKATKKWLDELREISKKIQELELREDEIKAQTYIRSNFGGLF